MLSFAGHNGAGFLRALWCRGCRLLPGRLWFLVMASEEKAETKTPTEDRPPGHPGRRRIALARRIALGFAAFIVLVMLSAVIASFFLDGVIRPRIERAMNQRLTGYHAALAHAHLQILGGRLTLNGLNVIQEHHPSPPVADLAMLQFTIQWHELVTGHVVADVILEHPKIRIDTPQVVAEKADTVPIQKKGWQDALESAYPFKINQFRIWDGDITYLDATDPKRPLHVQDLALTASNIRNLHYQGDVYPSDLHFRAVIFGKGEIDADGRANFLMQPFAGVRVKYQFFNIPLNAATPASRRVNLTLRGGVLNGNGLLEYSPKVARMEVTKGSLDDVDLTYVHTAQTAGAESQRVTTAGKAIEKQNNRDAVMLRVKEFDVTHSNFAFQDQEKSPNYTLFISDTQMKLANYSNHKSDGPARVHLRGKFMGNGDTTLEATFVSSAQGPDFSSDVAIQNTELPSMNDLLRAYGRFDVSAGLFALYMQMAVHDGDVTGYVKPMFSDLQLYNRAKDQSKPLTKQAYQLALAVAAKLLKNPSTQQVATRVELTGRLKNPNASTWQAVVEILQNAFIQAILPGFDRQAQPQKQSAG